MQITTKKRTYSIYICQLDTLFAYKICCYREGEKFNLGENPEKCIGGSMATSKIDVDRIKEKIAFYESDEENRHGNKYTSISAFTE